tara:strand:- start:452 stop:610 length:159 start_codon:yes stop_codon:yes gene_type:complete
VFAGAGRNSIRRRALLWGVKLAARAGTRAFELENASILPGVCTAVTSIINIP